ncbi:DUF3253 domain-containing protein [Metallococcus carri]|uniref:DUF3253 domain-containing protein n=1 Tax=Metallococcus carri TaxID=1656884 RepID=UPI002E29D4E9|nr:DUF3253 domain-containing protein [Metallococcus carri]
MTVAGDEPAQRTPDGRYLIIGGRRWRACDPAIPEKLRAELVAELMRARRAVRTDGDAARPAVQDAKVALGERGEPWWETPTPEGRADRLAAAIRTLLRHRRPSTICPSDAARVVGGEDWRSVMDQAREVAATLAEQDVLEVQQKGERVDPHGAKGPIRLAAGPQL